ncbi:hypothetical protein VA603_01515 [Stenotrophomonas sp. MH1]|uniref:Transmembrane protein n=1 Tax=Stenotrophomonas capsici TaxID=3110230 RepID=A0ABU5UYQ3_9GAMM|nr:MULTISPECIES: hypothetical protein [unclassified Stenotrophomonas]MEA5666217.1 hypothetical protein [Stenotrophomonas sp. MH1]
MYWLFLLLALAAFVFALSTTNMALLVLSLVAALVFMLLWVKGLYAAKFDGVVNDVPRPLHAAELQALREQLRPAATADAATTTSPSPAPAAAPAPPQLQDPNQP